MHSVDRVSPLLPNAILELIRFRSSFTTRQNSRSCLRWLPQLFRHDLECDEDPFDNESAGRIGIDAAAENEKITANAREGNQLTGRRSRIERERERKGEDDDGSRRGRGREWSQFG